MSWSRIALVVGAISVIVAVPLVSGTSINSAPVGTALGIGSIVLGVVLWVQHGLSDSSNHDWKQPATEPTDRVGWQVDQRLDPSTRPSTSPYRIRRSVRRSLDSVLVERGGLSTDDAQRHRYAGTWTTDPRAATFLGKTDVRPWSLRLRDWVTGDEFATNLQATVDEIDRLVTILEASSRSDPLLDAGWDDPDDQQADGRYSAASRDELADTHWMPAPRRRLDEALDGRTLAAARSATSDRTDVRDRVTETETGGDAVR